MLSFTMQRHFYIFGLFLLLGIRFCAFAQVKSDSLLSNTPALLFSGTSRLLYQNANNLPASSTINNRFVRWECQPTLALFNVPIGAHILLTSENDEARSSMNSIIFYFDVKAFQKILRQRVMDKAKETMGDYQEKASELQKKISDSLTFPKDVEYGELRKKNLTSITSVGTDELKTLDSNKQIKQIDENLKNSDRKDPKKLAKDKELKKLSREILDPSKLEEKLTEFDLMSGAERLLFGVKNLGIGVTYPHLSPWLMTGVTVQGMHIEYQLGLLNLAGTAGAMNPPVPDNRIATQTFDRNVLAGKIGLGSNEDTHFHLLCFYARDKESNILQDSIYSPAKNYASEVDCMLNLFNRVLILRGTCAGSMYTRDINAPSLVSEPNNDPTGLNVLSKLDPRISSTFDYAWKFGAELNLFGESTRGKYSIQRIGPGYISLGVPFLRNDIMGQEAELQQDALNGQIRFGSYYKQNQDNILPWKRTLVGDTWIPSRTVITSYGGTLDLAFTGIPYLRLEYAPYLQQTDIDTLNSGINNNTTLLSATLGYDYQLSTISGSTIVLLLNQNGSAGGNESAFHNKIYTVSQTLSFATPLMLSVVGSYSETQILSRFISIAGINSNASYMFSDFLRSSIGMNYSDRNDGGKRLGFTMNSKLKLTTNMEVEVRLDNNMYENGLTVDSSFEQTRLRVSFLNRW